MRAALSIIAMNFGTLRARTGAAIVIIAGIAGAVGIFTAAFAMLVSFQDVLARSTKTERAVILSHGAYGEFNSSLARNDVAIIKAVPGIKRDAGGDAVASPETMTDTLLTLNNGKTEYVVVRGLGPEGLDVHPEIKLTTGRMFRPALRELIVGADAARRFSGLERGAHISLPGGPWTVVGEFQSNDVHGLEMIGDAETLLSAFHHNAFQSMVIPLDSDHAFTDLKDAITSNPQLSVDVMTEKGYLARMTGFVTDQLNFIVYLIGGLLAVAGGLAALNAMYSAVGARIIEIATLRAIGFGAGTVLASILAEALLLALLGGCVGVAVAWTFIGTLDVQFAIRIQVSAFVVLTGLGVGLSIGFFGGFFPALRAARLPVATALQVR